MKILFVCTGNTCRSPMAENLMRKMLKDRGRADVTVSSAGIAPAFGLAFPNEARQVLASAGVEQVEHSPQAATEKLLEEADLVLVMEPYHREVLERRFPNAKAKIHLLKQYADKNKSNIAVADPFGQPVAAYAKALSEIRDALNKIIDKLG